ncbi:MULTISPECIES: alpha/beta hydrolase [Streptosporangium]|uniref:Pimeloyl-ACP methyl ester carboxylesterase n=1 Tax=Streptosporangium brasiliense TaxID=47480 RepID=A0ABT9R2A7_9ACTN|nr:alpha/beta hydrolase [Streptosporangium brasiliense]MDP9862555.1 pimeloyl-ACP methyl ester carboxylesterase [Streptosporangium brasiliense]
MTETDQPRKLVLVHGAWHGPCCWDRLVPELESRGWSASTVDLPSTSGDPDAGMYDDARAVREHLETVEGPVTVLAHSYGGVPVTEVAETVPNVERLVYLAAHMLNAGEAVITPIGGPWFPPETKIVPCPEPAREAFYHDVPAELADTAVARLRPQSARAFTEEQTRASWRTIPSALIVCDDDRSLPELFVKRQLTMADVVRHLPGGHSPFLSRPVELAGLIDEVTRTLAARD